MVSRARPTLSPIYRDTLAALKRMRDQNGIPPTQRELQVLLGVTNNAVRQRLHKLQEEGLVRLVPRSPRGIIVLDR